MPFIFQEKLANIDRSNKRSDEFIHKMAIKTLDSLSPYSYLSSNDIKILPTSSYDPSFKDANPELSFTTYAIKKLDLTWFEVEHWLDKISLKDQWTFYLETESSILNIDERRRYYRRTDSIKSYISYKPK